MKAACGRRGLRALEFQTKNFPSGYTAQEFVSTHLRSLAGFRS
jgi:hypothetical protein